MAITGAEPVVYYPLGDNSNPNAPVSFPNISEQIVFLNLDSVIEQINLNWFEFHKRNDFYSLGKSWYNSPH